MADKTSMSEQRNPVAHLREIADRLRIQGDYGNGWSDVADATACSLGADTIERLTRENEYLQNGYVSGLKYQIERLRGALIDLRLRLHCAGRRPEECYEMSIIDDALAWSITSDSPDTGAWLSVNASTGVLSGTPGTAETVGPADETP